MTTVENENHCDFRKLRSLLIRTHMLDLISTTEELHYENYRQAQMEVRKFGEQKPRKFENPKFKEEEEALRKRFTEQVKAEEARFRQWEQHVRIYRTPVRVGILLTPPRSLSKSAIVSTRTWKWLTAPSKRSRPSSTTCKQATAAAPAGGEAVYFLSTLRNSWVTFLSFPTYTHSVSLDESSYVRCCDAPRCHSFV